MYPTSQASVVSPAITQHPAIDPFGSTLGRLPHPQLWRGYETDRSLNAVAGLTLFILVRFPALSVVLLTTLTIDPLGGCAALPRYQLGDSAVMRRRFPGRASYRPSWPDSPCGARPLARKFRAKPDSTR
jgi:hypothetical protein